MSTERPANRLIHETSPYLLQHAHNPVDWHPWGPAALELARTQDKPLLLSVGYSACHWCHVMEHESFEDEATAALMNEHFVCIKVDREERPDLDKIYQLAHQMMTRKPGGWPLTVVLTPTGHAPIFAGTYFPREARYGMPGFGDVLTQIADHYDQHRGQFDDHDSSMRDAFAGVGKAGDSAEPTAALFEQAARELSNVYDATHGGFGSAPKFPHPTNLEALLKIRDRTEVEPGLRIGAANMLQQTLNAMADGGLNDQLRGGFCRYCVDADWTIPHFEKMLYDNGQLLSLYADAGALFSNNGYAHTVQDTVSWVMGEMQDAAGGYFSTLDADTEGEEGKFYVWSSDELREHAGDDWPLFSRHYGLDGQENFEGRWHLNIAEPLSDIAHDLQVTQADAQKTLDDIKARLLTTRDARVRPGLDDKVLTSWNGLMIRGMARAARVMQREDWMRSSERALDFVKQTLWQDDHLLATTRNGKTHLNAYLDDYVLMIDAVIELLRTRWRDGDIEFAIALADRVLESFEDSEEGGFFFTSRDHEKLLHRPKPTMDDAVPSGNAIAALSLGRLGHLLGDERYLDASARTLRWLTPHMTQSAAAHGAALMALDEYLSPPTTIVLRYGDTQTLEPWLEACRARYSPSRIVIAIPNDADNLPGILASRTAIGAADAVTAYVCTGFSCDAPTTSVDEFRIALER